MGVRLPPDTEIIKYTSNNNKQQQSSSEKSFRDESTSKKMKLDVTVNMKDSNKNENTNGLERGKSHITKFEN
jgi:hypothetical protein